jgi:transcriptional regulator with PAS, ATPase and Fis domain
MASMLQKRQIDATSTLILESGSMRRIDGMLRTVATKDVTVTLVGESGTGKEILARRVHDLSGRHKGPFIPINCAAIPEALFESELFGHERGAFTGATDRMKGKIDAAEGGTLFLDEIGEMPFAVQAKLLRFLENRRFMRVGGALKIQADVRLVVATLRAIDQEVRAGRFRADLYYRIQGITIPVPPLRERCADIGPLIAYFIPQISAYHGMPPPRLSRAARATLIAHDWPGNVRELRNTIEMICLLRSGRQVRVCDLPEPVQQAAMDRAGRAKPAIGSSLTIDLDQPDQPLDSIIDRVIEATLFLEHGSQSRAAERLGISVRTIQRHIARGLRNAEP